MGKRLSGSLTVEAVLLFPFIFLILIGMLQYGFYFTYKLWATCLCDQGVMLYRELCANEKNPNQAKEEVQKYVSEKLRKAGLTDLRVEISTEKTLLGSEVAIEAEVRLAFLNQIHFSVQTEGEYRPQRAVRDLVELIQEAGKRIPGVQKMLDGYKEMAEQCLESDQ